MELYQLRSFVTVAEERHLTRAAKRLFISQPAVSAHIKALEEELGLVLFTRTPQGMQLTQEGQVLKRQAEKALDSIDEFSRQAQSLRTELSGVMIVSLHTDPAFLRIDQFFSFMAEHYPKLEFHLLQRNSWEVADELRKGNFDVGFRYERETSPEFGVLSLHTYALHIVGPIQWKTQIEQAEWEEIAAFPWIWMPEYCPFSQILDAAFRKRHLEPCQVALTDQEPTIKTLVTSGVGLALMVEDEALASEREGKIAVWHKDALQVELSFIYLRKREHDPMIQAVLNGLSRIWNHER